MTATASQIRREALRRLCEYPAGRFNARQVREALKRELSGVDVEAVAAALQDLLQMAVPLVDVITEPLGSDLYYKPTAAGIEFDKFNA